MVDLEPLIEADDVDFVQVAMMKHITHTGSRYAEQLLADWGTLQRTFVKVMPRDYKRALAADARRRAEEAALLEAAPIIVPILAAKAKKARGVAAKKPVRPAEGDAVRTGPGQAHG
jgi:hypothetical protein